MLDELHKWALQATIEVQDGLRPRLSRHPAKRGRGLQNKNVMRIPSQQVALGARIEEKALRFQGRACSGNSAAKEMSISAFTTFQRCKI
jgi:hypothetical protein